MEELSIGQICSRFSSGRNIKAANIHESGLYPVYGSNGLRGFTDSYNYDGECAIVGRQGAYCGNVKYVSGKSYMSEHAIVAKTNPNHNNKYFAYKLSLAKLGRFSGQAAQPGLSVTKLLRLKFEMPSKQYQDRIASILSAYDSLIENNTKRIRLLEKMAENLYKEWFVRFRFPGYEKAEMENGLPKGWKVEALENLLDIRYGKDHKKLDDGDVPIYGSGGIIRYGNTSLYNGSSVLIPRKGSLNNIIYVEGKFWTVDTMFYSVPKKNNICFYLYYVLSMVDMTAYNAGAALPSMTTAILNRMKVVLPDGDALKRFEGLLQVYYKQKRNLQHQNTLLARQRDLLLPRLMSGKLEVKP